MTSNDNLGIGIFAGLMIALFLSIIPAAIDKAYWAAAHQIFLSECKRNHLECEALWAGVKPEEDVK